MRLTLATLLMMASSPAWAGDLMVGDAAAAKPPAATAKPPGAPATASAAAAPYAGLYDAPLFGHAAPALESVDEAALRFYAGQKNRARVEAEIRRLRALHPAWRVPPNLYASAGGDEQPLWALFAAGRSEELRTAIQAREARDAGWRPSADLLAKMARAETAVALKALSDGKDWARFLALAAAHPDALSCSALDLDWRVAEAFAALGSPERAYEVDAAILASCRDRDERLTTVRKAADALPAAAVDRLIAAGAVLADGSGEFDDVRLDLARRQIGDSLAATAAGDDVAAANLDALGLATLRSGDAADAALLGWYGHRRGRWAEADGWFRLALRSSGGDAKLAEGHALALKELGRTEEAERLAHAWRDRSPALRSLFVALVTARLGSTDASTVDPAEMADFTAILVAERSVAAAGALGWAAHGRGDLDAAALWFARAVDWSGAGDLPDKVAEGYGLTLARTGRLAEAEDVLYARRGRSAAARDLYIGVVASALAGGASPGAEGPGVPAAPVSPERMDRFAATVRAARSPSGAAALGWRSLRDGGPLAVDWFRDAAAWSPDGIPDLPTLEGLVLALKDAGRLSEAEDAAYPRVGESAQLRDAYRGLVTAQLVTPALAERLTAGRVLRFAAFTEAEASASGAEALGWYRLLGDDRCGYAVDWFRRAVAWSPDRRGTAKAGEGLARALSRAGHDFAAADAAAAWADGSPDMKTLDVALMTALLTRDLFPRALDEDRLGRFAVLVRAERSAPGAQALGWYRYRDAGAGYGVDWFADAIRWSPGGRADAKTVEGYASALRDVGRLADAEDALFPWVDRVPVMRELYIDTVVSELTQDDPPEPMPPDRLARFVAVATPLRSAAAAQALGWYRFARHELPDAAIWFKHAVDWWPAPPTDADRSGDGSTDRRWPVPRPALTLDDYRRTPRAFAGRVHDAGSAKRRTVDTFAGLATTWTGYALTLRAAGRSAEAEAIATAWRDRWPMLGRLFVDLAVEALARRDGPPVDPGRLKGYAAAIEGRRDPEGAAALGWAAAARRDPAEAAVWLKAALDWRPADAAPDARAMAGYVDALRAAGRIEDAYAAASAWSDRVPGLKPKLADVAVDLLASSGSAADGAAAVSPDRLAQAVALVEAEPGPRGAAALGWHHLGARRPATALPFFKAAVTRSSAADASDADASVLPKAVEGLALTLRALGRHADALAFAEAWTARVPALAALSADAVADLLGRDGGKGALDPDLVGRMATSTLRSRSVPAAAAFGWYSYGRRDWGRAAEWFADGLSWSPDGRAPVKLVEGYAASLRNQCRFDEAARAALSRFDEDGDGRLHALYVDSVADRLSRAGSGSSLPPAEASRFAAATVAASSANGAQALGWYAYRSRQFAAAAAWFEKALSWRASESDVYGLALSYRRLGDAAGLSRLSSRYEARFASLGAVRRAGIGGREPPMPDFGDVARRDCARPVDGDRADATGAIAPPAMVTRDGGPVRRRVAPAAAAPPPVPRATAPGGAGAALAAKDYARCLSILDRRPARTADERQVEGWCLLGADRPAEAAEAFRAGGVGASGRSAGDGALGEALSHLRQGDAAAAVGSAAGAPIAAGQRRGLGLQILSRQAFEAYAGGRWAESLDLLRRRSAFGTEPRDLTMLRGWSLYHQGDLVGARGAFARANAQLSDRDSRNALATVDAASTDKAFR